MNAQPIAGFALGSLLLFGTVTSAGAQENLRGGLTTDAPPLGAALRLPSAWSAPDVEPVQREPTAALRVIYPVAVGVSKAVRDLPPAELAPGAEGVVPLEGFMFPLPRRVGESGAAEQVIAEPVPQDEVGIAAAAPPPIQNFEGIRNADNPFLLSPPDTNGDVGLEYYVQMVNVTFAIWDKNGNQLQAPTPFNALFSSLPSSLCATTNRGDPIVLYDPIAHRWLLSQFAFATAGGDPAGPYHQCIAVSQTSDPTGSYYLYDFVTDQTLLNDYPKFGVWPDAYYMSVNQFDQNSNFAFAGAGVAAFERTKMLAGNPTARLVYIDTNNPSLGGMLPADLDGSTPPPSGDPGLFAQFDDNPDQLEIWEFDVDFATPLNSTFTHLTNLATQPFDSILCLASRGACIDQPSPGVDLEDLADRLMHRLAYRNFGDHESMVVDHTVDANGLGKAGVRWYELRKTGGSWTIHQQGTYAPDGNHRWMGSIAMDGEGNIGLGYSVSSNSTFPSIRYTGRLADDPPGTLLAESQAVAGGGVQTGSHRWGDYSAMAVDPADDCTFWYTQEYYQTTSSVGWRTRIASFDLCDFAPSVWPAAYAEMLYDPSALEVLRKYRDNVLNNTAMGKAFTRQLYQNSNEAFNVLMYNPSLMSEASTLIAANKDAVNDVLAGKQAVITNTADVASFLKRFAKQSPPKLRALALRVRAQMLKKARAGEPFLGLHLKTQPSQSGGGVGLLR